MNIHKIIARTLVALFALVSVIGFIYLCFCHPETARWVAGVLLTSFSGSALIIYIINNF